jgi:cytochrome c oxidase subunit 4
MGYLNLGSFLLGLIAWVLPIINLVKRNRGKHKKWYILCLSSLCACTVSLLMQIFYTNYRIRMEDWSALMDTNKAVVLVSTVLFLVVLILNVITLVVYKTYIPEKDS